MQGSLARSHGATALGPLHEGLARLTGWRAAGMAALLGAFSALAFAPFHFTAALAVSLTGLVWMIDGARGARRWGRSVFARGWAFGFGFFLVSLYWTASPFLVEPERTALLIWMPLILLPGGMALIWGAAMAMAGAFWSASPSRVFMFTVFFALGEMIRGHLFGGFPWNLAGTSWVPGGPMSQAAALGGVYWLTLVTVFICAAPAALVDTRETRGLAGRILPLLLAVLAAAGLWSWGAQRLMQPTELTARELVLMDAGVPQNQKFRVPKDQVLRRYAELLVNTDTGGDDLVIWPEGALPVTMLQDDQSMDVISAYLGNRTLIAGTARYISSGLNLQVYYNSLAVLNRDSNRSGALGLYDKHRLVPMGELPLSRILPFGEQISSVLPSALQRLATSGFEPGEGPAIVYGERMPPFVAMICYEALYPSVPRTAQRLAGHRADWLVTISNDAWFGEGLGPAQHYAQNRYRAIETGLPMARVASRGTSAVIDGFGRELARGRPVTGGPDDWTAKVAKSALPAPVALPVYQTRAGALFFWVTLAAMVVLAFFAWRR